MGNLARKGLAPEMGGAQKWRHMAPSQRAKLVDLIGIEPMTSSMPWNEFNRKL
jgi:hypothetical protein